MCLALNLASPSVTSHSCTFGNSIRLCPHPLILLLQSRRRRPNNRISFIFSTNTSSKELASSTLFLTKTSTLSWPFVCCSLSNLLERVRVRPKLSSTSSHFHPLLSHLSSYQLLDEQETQIYQPLLHQCLCIEKHLHK
jgi:hypothetical protein